MKGVRQLTFSPNTTRQICLCALTLIMRKEQAQNDDLTILADV